ncbi:MAG: squalene/phytoene synthase family protein [Bacteroidales bacterium]|nr:squalene/phytoene synthase family protein [Bacteroidales bacterium]
MKALYDDVSFRISKLTTKAYTTSFALGIRLFEKKFHDPIYAIYGFVRLADEIVDSFHGFDKETLMAEFRKDTELAIERKISLNPILNSFQETVHRYGIKWAHIDRFLKSMEMDLDEIEYNQMLYEDYILGSAEVVGLMCLHVFAEGSKEKYKELVYPAMRLGSAFQKINFFRDMHNDHNHLGRTYFPGLDVKSFDAAAKKRIEDDIAKDFKDGLDGIKKLPVGARYGVYVAYVYYFNLFKKIKRLHAKRLLEDKRIRVPNTSKYLLLVTSYVRFRLNIL